MLPREFRRCHNAPRPAYASRAGALTDHHIRDKTHWPAQRPRPPKNPRPIRRLRLVYLARGPNLISLACTRISTAGQTIKPSMTEFEEDPFLARSERVPNWRDSGSGFTDRESSPRPRARRIQI